jgi:hypothetical protein
MKNSLIASAGLMLLLFTIPAQAQIHIGLGIRIGPPAPVHEVIVERPFSGAVWIPGFYRWHAAHRSYVWVPGRWTRMPRPGVVWIPERWERRRGEWVFYEGRWGNERPERRERPKAHERRRNN